MKKLVYSCLSALLLNSISLAQEMDHLWGESTIKLRPENSDKGQLFDEGNYAMFIHWGLYSHIENRVDGKTYYGIGEWIMNPRVANIPPEVYKKETERFDPSGFNAKEIVTLAKESGMKYIIITAKHHDGFAMYHSKVNSFNIVDATPWGKDPMKELADECKTQGLGFGFYYSHNQDWTFPGGDCGPEKDAAGNPATFDDYFKKKCLPQVEELLTEYGPIELIWFDTPGEMPKDYIQILVDTVHKHQPKCLVSGRAGHNLGDYQTLGDMEVPTHNVKGMWESVDTTNDSWAYAWYDQNWKSPKKILHRLISCVGRGGTYMLNVGPDGKGVVPPRAQQALLAAGEWIKKYPQVVYNVGASPWGHALPWGDVTSKESSLFLSVFDWPRSGKLYVPGLKVAPKKVSLYKDGATVEVKATQEGDFLILEVPITAPEELVSVIQLDFDSAPEVSETFAVDPELGVEIEAGFAKATNAEIIHDRWMEKFGEWLSAHPVTKWQEGGKASWEVIVPEAGDYAIDLTYAGKGRLVFKVEIEGGEAIQNQQNSSHIYEDYPIGWLNFPKAGKYTISASCIEGETATAKLKALHISPIK